MRLPTNDEKQAVRDASQAGKPIRVPLNWGCNSRIVLLDPDLNPEGYTYQQMLTDPTVPPIMQSRFDEYCGTTLAETCDRTVDLPETWAFSYEYHNVSDGAYFGAPIQFRDGQVPSVEPYYGIDEVDALLARDFSRPLENPWIQQCLRFREELQQVAERFTYLGRKGRVLDFTLNFDGPLTIATILFGTDIFLFLLEEPEKARELMLYITRACILRNQALLQLAGQPCKGEWGGIADDSIQLISTALYEDIVMPAHELWFSEMSTSTPANRRRSIHLCGDATRHFPVISEKLGVSSFDTGFPVDHGALRRTLGPEVFISGGPPTGLLRHSTPELCYAETRHILQSGIMEGGKFSLREGNNLPPCVPIENLTAVYEACLTYGWYTDQAPA